jgi:predicted glycosyltransferase
LSTPRHGAACTQPRKIWIDIENSPHVLFFRPLIREFERRGFDVLITVRDYAQAIGLARLHGLDFIRVGRHYGRHKLMKLAGMLVRCLRLIPIVLRERPDVAFSHGCRSQYVTARLMRIPSAMAYDYEHSARVPLFNPDLELAPEVVAAVTRRGTVRGYPGIKEDVYCGDLVPDPSLRGTLGIGDDEVLVTVRPPATLAHYHHKQSETLYGSVMDRLCRDARTRVVVVPRTADQAESIRRARPDAVQAGKIIIPDRVLDGLNLVWCSDLVVSGGGTMIREAAALNVPAYSTFGGRTGAVDRYLEESGKLALLRSEQDIERKLRLEPRDRQPDVPVGDPRTLTFIADAVEGMIRVPRRAPLDGMPCRDADRKGD